MNLYFLAAKVLAAVALMAALAWAWHLATEHYVDIGRVEVQTKWDDDILRRREQVSAITLLWDQQRIAAEAAGKERDDERQKHFKELAQRARTLPAAVARVVVPSAAVSVLDDAIRAGGDHAAPAGPTGEADATASTAPAASAIRWGGLINPFRQLGTGEQVTAPVVEPVADADSTVGMLTEWGVKVVEMYDTCRARVADWQTWYAGLQAAQAKVQP